MSSDQLLRLHPNPSCRFGVNVVPAVQNMDGDARVWKPGSVTIPGSGGGGSGSGLDGSSPSAGDLQWRLQMSEQVRKKSVERIIGVLRASGWEEPQTRPKGRAFEDVLISVRHAWAITAQAASFSVFLSKCCASLLE